MKMRYSLQNIQEIYTNGSGLTVRTTQYPKPNEPINTYFAYDPINQLEEVTDAMGKKTISEYDKAGRRISVTHPASDTTTFEYDEGSNLIAKQTANLRQAGAGKKIRYTYTFNRPDSIIYPDHPENNVIYSYGSASDSSGFNRKGRLVSLTDGSGRQEFKYGRQGELTELSRTLVIPNQGVATYTTRWNYDSWNRLLKMTYPDGEEVNYGYNVAGLLNKVTGVKAGDYTDYVTDIKYDQFEQRTYINYGNGTETNYTYKPDNRLLNTLSVQKGSAVLMNNTYTYDAVQNVTGIVNSGVPGNTIGGNMTHSYFYDKLYRLDSASGDFIGDNGKKARYNLSMRYDNLHNITRKKQDIVQNGIKFGGILNAGYDLSYNYADNSQQIANIADQSYRVERSSQATYQTGSQAGDAISSKAQTFTYDANGNMTLVATGKMLNDSTLQATTSRQMLWDEENRLLAINDNGYVSNYWYDAAGERTVKESFDSEGVFINGVLSGARTGTGKFTAYVSPYLVVNNGGYYSKHIYMGSQRITSKLGSSEIFHDSVNPIAPANPHNLAMAAKLSTQNAMIQNRFDSLGVVYRGISQGSAGLITSIAGRIASPQLYFYHPDHLGSSSLITDGNGTLVQHLEYLPFGEVFVEENKSTWSTPYKFSAKELDDETGLYYFGARYYDSRLGVWLSVDPLREKYPNVSSYVYCLNNPVKFVDPDGRNPAGAALLALGASEYLLITSGVITVGTILYLGLDGMIRIKEDVKTKLSIAVLTSLTIELLKLKKITAMGEVLINQKDNANASSPEQRKEQKRRENKSRLEDVETAKAHNEMVENGAPTPDPLGNVNPKKPIKTVIGAYIVLKLYELYHNLTETINQLKNDPPQIREIKKTSTEMNPSTILNNNDNINTNEEQQKK